MIKKNILFFVFAAVFFPVAMLCAQSGTTGDLSWNIDSKGVMTVSGSGEMRDYKLLSFPPWNEHKSKIKQVVIEEGAMSIGSYAFYSCGSLERISLPKGLKKIGSNAFYSCTLLSEAVIPDDVTEIGGDVFYKCTSLRKLVFGRGVQALSGSVIFGCESLTSLVSLATVPPVASTKFLAETFLGAPAGSCTLYVPEAGKTGYQGAKGWKTFKNIVGLDEDKLVQMASSGVHHQNQSMTGQSSSTQGQNQNATSQNSYKEARPFVTERTKKIKADWITYEQFKDFSDGIAFVNNPKKKPSDYDLFPRNNAFGAIDTEGNKVIDFVLDYSFYVHGSERWDFPRYNSGVCIVYGPRIPGGKYKDPVIIDKKGEIVKELKNVRGYTQFRDSVAHVQEVYTGANKKNFYKFYYVNPKGEKIFPHLTADVSVEAFGGGHYLENVFRDLHEGLRAYWSYKSGYGFIDSRGRIIVEPRYRMVHDFSDGMAAVQNKEELWGFIDATGKLVIDFVFTKEPGDFSEGWAVVFKRDGESRLIDKAGNIQSNKLDKYTVNYNQQHKRFVGGVMLVGLSTEEKYSSRAALLNKDLQTARFLPNTYSDAAGKTISDDFGSGIKKIGNHGEFVLNNDHVYSSKFEFLFRYSRAFHRLEEFNGNLARFHFAVQGGSDLMGYMYPNGEVAIMLEHPEW